MVKIGAAATLVGGVVGEGAVQEIDGVGDTRSPGSVNVNAAAVSIGGLVVRENAIGEGDVVVQERAAAAVVVPRIASVSDGETINNGAVGKTGGLDNHATDVATVQSGDMCGEVAL